MEKHTQSCFKCFFALLFTFDLGTRLHGEWVCIIQLQFNTKSFNWKKALLQTDCIPLEADV